MSEEVKGEVDRGKQHLSVDPNDPRNVEPAVSNPKLDINKPE